MDNLGFCFSRSAGLFLGTALWITETGSALFCPGMLTRTQGQAQGLEVQGQGQAQGLEVQGRFCP